MCAADQLASWVLKPSVSGERLASAAAHRALRAKEACQPQSQKQGAGATSGHSRHRQNGRPRKAAVADGVAVVSIVNINEPGPRWGRQRERPEVAAKGA